MKLKQVFLNAYYGTFYGRRTACGPVFIIGTGRSGTHFLCSCLNRFDQIDDYYGGRESPRMFRYITRLTLKQKALPQSVIGYYCRMQEKVAPSLFLDQTHPNIWHVEQLLKEFPKARFLAISRNVYSVMFSMTNHHGVYKWNTMHAEFPKPNAFLGITKENRRLYEEELSDLQRGVFRWCAHQDRITYLAEKFPKAVLRMRYEDLHDDMDSQMERVARFLGVEKPRQFEPFKAESLRKKEGFSDEQIAEIDRAQALYWGKHSQTKTVRGS